MLVDFVQLPATSYAIESAASLSFISPVPRQLLSYLFICLWHCVSPFCAIRKPAVDHSIAASF